jgi:hypothetical protein
MRWLRWLFWSSIYAFQPTPKGLLSYLRRGMRCRPPWWKFKPHIFRNEDGKMWQVFLTDEASFTIPRQRLPVEIHMGMDSNQIVGFNVFDEHLTRSVE